MTDKQYNKIVESARLAISQIALAKEMACQPTVETDKAENMKRAAIWSILRLTRKLWVLDENDPRAMSIYVDDDGEWRCP